MKFLFTIINENIKDFKTGFRRGCINAFQIVDSMLDKCLEKTI
jgi:hypothetical protein